MRKRKNEILVLLTMLMFVFTGCTTEEEYHKSKDNKPEIEFYGKCMEYSSGPMMVDKLKDSLNHKYNLDAYRIDWENQLKVIRTGIASESPCDVYNYPVTQMKDFANMAIDLTPYLQEDPEWKSCFTEKQLNDANVEGKILSVPWEDNFPIILANKKKLDELNIEIPQQWTMEEFMDVCKRIKASGVYPFANATDMNRGSWLFRNAMLSETMTLGTYEMYCAGQLSYYGEETRNALENIRKLYELEYMYPGDNAVSVKNDEIKASFYKEEVIMMTEIASGARKTAGDAKNFEVILIPWPSSNKVPVINGGYNGLFIPKNCKNIEASVEVIKQYTGNEIQKIHADEGYIPANKKVRPKDGFVRNVIEQEKTMCTREYFGSDEMNEYVTNSLMKELILENGVQQVIETLENFRMMDQER